MSYQASRRWFSVALFIVTTLVVAVPHVGASELDVQETDDFGPSEMGAPAPQCKIGVCLDIQAPFSDTNLDGAADPLVGGGKRDWGTSGWSIGLCCNGHQRLEIAQSADNGPTGPSDCRDTPLVDINAIGCKAGGDVGVGKTYVVNTLGQSYAALATVKLGNVHEPEPGMFRARLTIHGYDAAGRLQQECNAFLRSTEVDDPNGNPVPGTADQTAVFVPIEIPECEMVDAGPHNGVGNTIVEVDVMVRANAFKNDIAYGTVRVEKLTFVRLS